MPRIRASNRSIIDRNPPSSVRSWQDRFQVIYDRLGDNPTICLKEEAELTLAKHLLQFDSAIVDVERDLLPNRLCNYLFELSQKFNQFYDSCPVLPAAEPERTSRLILCNIAGKTLKLGLNLLGIATLDRM
jgi:arginyl-tRNA synthetase